MKTQDFTTTLLVNQTPAEVFAAINNVQDWWSEDFSGASKKLQDEFEVHFWDVHFSRQKITSFIDNQKVVWLVTDCHLAYLQNKTEWNGTEVIFEISRQGGQTQLRFTHKGLVPAIECYNDCSRGWTHYLNDSLLSLITTGKGQPTEKTAVK